MTRHSKNNTNAAFFSNAERAQLSGVYGTRMARVEASSQREFDACCLCLKAAVNPVVCECGHLFCKECSIEHILAENGKIKDAQIRREELKRERESLLEMKREAEQQRLVESFKAQNHFGGYARESLPDEPIALYPDEPIALLPDEPVALLEAAPKKKETVRCPMGNHSFVLKRLLPVKLLKECRTCRKSFHKESEIIINVPCGDLCCKECKQRDSNCAVCSEPLTKTMKLAMDRKGVVKELLAPAPKFS